MKFSCPQCGGECQREDRDILVSCQFCGTELLVREGNYEVVDAHLVVEPKVTEDDLVSRTAAAHDWELIYFPFWVVEGEFHSTFRQLETQEALLRFMRRDLEAQVSTQGTFYVAARETLPSLGIAFEAAADRQAPDTVKLADATGIPYDKEKFAGVNFLHGQIEQEEALQVARRSAEWLQRDAVNQSLPTAQLVSSDQKMKPARLVHRPFWVNSRQEALDAVSGEKLEKAPAAQVTTRQVKTNTMATTRLALGVVFCWLAPLMIFLGQETHHEFTAFCSAIVSTLVGVGFLVFFAAPPELRVEEQGVTITSAPLEKAIIVYLSLTLLYSIAPVLLLLGPIAVVVYPFIAGIWGMLEGKGLFRSFFRGVKKSFYFCVRAFMVLIVYLLASLGTLTALLVFLF